jgi:hypothetical protein
MKKSLMIVGSILTILALIIYFLDPYTPPEDIRFPLSRCELGEPNYNYLKSTKIEKWLGPYGGTYSFWLRCEKVGDLVNVDVYVDGALVDKFVEVNWIGEKSYAGKEKIVIFITAVRYSESRYEPFYLEFVYSARLIRYGGYLYPQFYALAPLLLGIAFYILSLKRK